VVTITVITGYAFLKLDVGEVGNQLRENGSADIHPTIVPPTRRNAILTDSTEFGRFQFKSFFVQTPPTPLMTMKLPDFKKYFTGH